MKINYECPQCRTIYKKDKSSIYRNKKRGTAPVICPVCKLKNSLIDCKQCAKKFKSTGRDIFCSQSCSATYNNTHRIRKDNKKTILCACCKEETKNKKFCSRECSSNFRAMVGIENHKKLINDLSNDMVSEYSYHTIHHHLKQHLKEEYGEKCCLCDWNKTNPTTGKIPIELDHIDGNCENNKPNNVRLLCPSCHSLTPHFKGANRTYKNKNSISPRYAKWKESVTST